MIIQLVAPVFAQLLNLDIFFTSGDQLAIAKETAALFTSNLRFISSVFFRILPLRSSQRQISRIPMMVGVLFWGRSSVAYE